jgi:hypothetical protein
MNSPVDLFPQQEDPNPQRRGRSGLEMVQMVVGAVIAIVMIAVGSIFAGLMVLSLRSAILSTLLVVAAYGSAIGVAITGLRGERKGPVFTGVLIGGIIGCLGCGLCSTILAIDSAGGLNIH